ncbi:MAG: hypothetical protein N3C12_08390 [Candidatus Binatia bacterium]|nr:hypothetical protein [Candidatus Binatia bacterium]
MQSHRSRAWLAVLLIGGTFSVSGCYVHRSGWLAVRQPTPGQLSRTSPVVWLSFESGGAGHRRDPQHGRLRAALVTALQDAGAIVVDPGATEGRHLALTVRLNRGAPPSTAAMLANAVLFGMSIGIIPLRESTTLEVAVQAESVEGREHAYTYRERITIWHWLPSLLLPRQDPVYADQRLLAELAGTVVADLQRDGLLPQPIAAHKPLRLSSLAHFRKTWRDRLDEP